MDASILRFVPVFAFLFFGLTAAAQDRINSGIPRIVIMRDEIQRQNIRNLDQLFDGQVPGIIAVDRGASNTTTLRSRGMSSVNSSALPRIYLNEVPLASVASIHEIAVESVDSVVAEVGAAAGALTGAGAGGGIVRIYTKRGRVNTPIAISGKTVGGLDQSLYKQNNKFFHDQTLDIEGGGKSFTYYTGVGYGQETNWAPNYKNALTHSNASITGYSKYVTVTLHGRINSRKYDPADIRLDDQSFQQYKTNTIKHSTYGVTAAVNTARWWRNELFYGAQKADERSDQSQASHIDPFDVDVVDRSSDRERTTIIYHTSITLPKYGAITPVISAGYDRSRLKSREQTSIEGSGIPGTLSSTVMTEVNVEWEGIRGNLGIHVGDNFVFNAGVRRDSKDGSSVSKIENPTLRPRYDAAYLFGSKNKKDLRVTLRAAHGEVINPGLIVGLKPEVLKGSEAGFDVDFGATQISTTFFQQKGKDGELIVLFPFIAAFNAVDVKNQGLSSSIRTVSGPWTFTSSYTAYHSEDEKVISALSFYPLRKPINDFPSQNGHASLSCTDELGTLGIDVRYVGPHREQDINQPPFTEITYPGFATFDLNMSKPIGSSNTLILFVHNIANLERYGLYNGDYVYGRRFGLGIRYTKESGK